MFRLHRLSVLAWALGGGGARSVEALGILAKGAKKAGDTFPFDDGILNAVRSFAPTLPPDSYLLQLGKDAWSKWTSDGYRMASKFELNTGCQPAFLAVLGCLYVSLSVASPALALFGVLR